jgi:polysaccharide pyruvyl transferase CsaB
MKIGIVGNYGHDNNGDEAILQGILQQLCNDLSFSKEDIVIFSNNPENTVARYSISSVYLLKKEGNFVKSVIKTILQHIKVVRKLDVLIIGGGGVLMDMFKRDAPLYSTLVFIAKAFKCKIIIYGVGAGPINTPLGTSLIKGMAHAASLIAVRDEQSRDLLIEKGVKKDIKVIPDPALTLGDLNQKVITSTIKKVGVTAVPYFSPHYWPESNEAIYTNYITSMAKNLDKIVSERNVEIVFYSTKYPQDVQVTMDIYNKMEQKKSVKVLDANLHPNELIKLSQELDLVIGTRLHSLILSVAAGTPVIGIGYHKKVESFMRRINQKGSYTSLEDLQDPQRFLHFIENLTSNWEEVQKEYLQISHALRLEIQGGQELIRGII